MNILEFLYWTGAIFVAGCAFVALVTGAIIVLTDAVATACQIWRTKR